MFGSLDFWGHKIIRMRLRIPKYVREYKRKGRLALRRDDLINALLLAKGYLFFIN